MNIKKNGSTSNIVRVFLPDSASTTGAGKTGLTSASGGLIISTIAHNEASATTYTAAGSTTETITTLGTFAAPTSTKCRFKEVDATNFPGMYEIQIADARWAVSSAKDLIISIQATGVVPTFIKYQLSSFDVDDAVRGGLTALPNAAAEASGGLYTRGTGAGQINQDANGRIDANAKAWAGTATTLSSGVPDVNTKTWNSLATVALPLVPTTAGRTLDVSAGGEAGVDWANIGSPTTTVALSGTTVGTITTYTGNTVQTGDSYARIGVAGVGLTNLGDTRIANLDAAVSSRMATYTQPTGFLAATFPSGTVANTTNITAGTMTTTTNLTNAPTAGDFTATMKTSLNAATPALSAAGVQAIWDALTSALTTVGSIGKLLVTNIDATVSSRLASASYTAPPTANQNADALLDRAAGIETGITPRQGLRLMLAADVGKTSGAATPTFSIRDTNDSIDRVVATVDADGNRSAITLDAS